MTTGSPRTPPGLPGDRRAGRLILLTGLQTWTFDVCTNAWAPMHPASMTHELHGTARTPLVYDADSNVAVAIASGRALVYDLRADTWTARGAVPAPLKGPVDLAHDAASGLVVVMGQTSDARTDPWGLWAYDVETGTYTIDLVALAAYPHGSWVVLSGTGRFAGATGAGTFAGVSDFASGMTSIRYRGSISY